MELFRLLGTIAIDNTNAKTAIDEYIKKARDSEKETKEAFNKIGEAAKKIGTGIGVASAAIGGAFIAAVEVTREYRMEMAKLDTAFVTNGHSSEVAKKTYSELNAILGDTGQAVEAANHLALLTENEKDLQTWTDICTGVYATFGSSLPIEGLTESANETAKTGVLTGNLVDSLVWAGISEDEFNEKLAACSNEQERQNLIMETLEGTYKDASKQYKETNKDVIEAQKAQERLSDAMAEVGRIGEPILTAIKNKIAEFAEAAVPAVEDFIKKVKETIKWVKENEDTIQAWVGVILGATVAIGTFLLILNWGTVMNAAANAIKAVRLAIVAMNSAMLANPIGLIVAALAGLVVAFIYLWNNCEEFREFWIDLWKIIKDAALKAWEWIKNAWQGAGEWFSKIFSSIKESGKKALDSVKKFFSDAWSGIKVVWDFVKPYFEFLWNHIKLVFSVVKSVLTGDFSGAWEGIKGIWNNAKNYFLSVWNGISGIFNKVGSWFGEKFRNAWSNIKNAFSGFGSFFSGIWSNIKNIFSSVSSWFSTKFRDALSGVKNIWNGAKSYFSGIWSNIKNTFSNVGTWFSSKFKSAYQGIKNAFSGFGSFFSGLWGQVKNKFGSIGTKIGESMGGAVKSAMNKVLGKIETSINKGIKLINNAIDLANKLPGISVGKVKEISLPRLFKGGVLEKGQVGLLEGSGAEAVVPLERNTEWIAKVAETLNVSLDKSSDASELCEKMDTIIVLLNKLLGIDKNVYLDSGVLVGQMAPMLDKALGNRAAMKNRRNV